MDEINTNLKDGIYFNMPFKVYMAQKRHSVSRVKKVNEGPLVFWVDEIEPTLADDFDLDAHLDETTEAMAEGRAWHTMALEGPEVFEAEYATDYDPSKFPKALKSKDEHMKACANNGVAFKKSETIAALQAALIAAGVDVQFHSVLKAEHQERAGGKRLISPSAYEELIRAGKIMRLYNIQEQFLSDGFPEVSILFTMKGEKYKIRVDWLAADKQIEFKTITRRSRTKPFEEACADQMHDMSYMPAGYLYSEGVRIAREGLADGTMQVHDMPDTDWRERFIAASQHRYSYLFQERGKYNHVLIRHFDKYDEVIQNRRIQSIWKTGQLDVEHAVKIYNHHMEKDGLENPWLPELSVKAWDDNDFKPWQIVE